MKVCVSQLSPGDTIVGYLQPLTTVSWLYASVGLGLERVLVTFIRLDARNSNKFMTHTGRLIYCYDAIYDCVNR